MGEPDKFVARHAAYREENGQDAAHHHGRDQQPERNRDAGKAVAVGPQQGFPVL